MSNNYRYRVSLPPLTGIASYHVNTGPEEAYTSINYWTDFESIYDRINPVRYGTAGHRAPGSVWHNKVIARKLAPYTVFTDPDGNRVYMNMHAASRLGVMYPGNSTRNMVTFSGWLNLIQPFESTETYKNLCVSAFNKQIQQVPTKTSVINFLVELIELKSVFKGLAKVPDFLRKGAVARRVSMRSLSRNAPLKAASKGAKTFLAVEFQWLPFISDIQAFITSMDRVTKRLNFLLKTKGQETTVRFVKEDCRSMELGEILVYDDSSDVRQSVWLDSYQCDFVSTWKLFQDLEGLDDAWASLRGVFADLGVNNPAKIVWNAIPFSFLLDWVAPVSSWLERVAVQPFYGRWDVYDVTSSVHEKIAFSNRFLAKRGGTYGTEFEVHVDSYRRLNYLPISAGAIDFSQLTDTQQKLAAALVISKF